VQISFPDFSDRRGDHAAKLRSRVIDLRMTGGKKGEEGGKKEGKGPPDGIGEQTRYLRARSDASCSSARADFSIAHRRLPAESRPVRRCQSAGGMEEERGV